MMRSERPKIITFYLPQFHTIPENDEWWGKGFTDWVSAKNAKPLFPKHYQPRLPAHNYYYNLLDRETMRWQAQLAKKAGIYGFCIYHYWFGDDKQLLEKPAENLLKWKEIDINYCFSWANDSWVCSWSNLSGNAWVNTKRDRRNNKNHKGMLVEQKYGDEKEWQKHFEYLLPFFKDKRYIKKDKKPVFIIYNPHKIKCLKEMIRYWNLLALEQGFTGIYFIGTNCPEWKKNEMDAGLQYEPAFAWENEDGLYQKAKKKKDLWKKANITIPYIHSYNKIWKRILSRRGKKGMYLGGFVAYDDSPRRGRDGNVVQGMSPWKFGRYFGQLYKKAWKRGDEYLFLNAWNEWGEGAYLEPDSKYGIRCLQEIRNITGTEKNKKVEK